MDARAAEVAASEPDTSTYMGRVAYFRTLTDIRTLFTPAQEMQRSVEIMRQFRAGTLPQSVPASEIISAKNTYLACIHPDLEEPIHPFFRMSAAPPVNMVIVGAMMAARSPLSVLLTQTINQGYNVGVNYANRNASNVMSVQQIATSAVGALVSAVGASMGLNELVKRSSLRPAVKNLAMGLVPFVAVSVANIFNITLMRWPEVSQGISVSNEEGERVGQSVIAGRQAVTQTIISRILMITPVMVSVPIILQLLKPVLGGRPAATFGLNLALTGFFIWLFLPLTISVYPQVSTMDVRNLEPQFQSLTLSNGQPVQRVTFNKGL